MKRGREGRRERREWEREEIFEEGERRQNERE